MPCSICKNPGHNKNKCSSKELVSKASKPVVASEPVAPVAPVEPVEPVPANPVEPANAVPANAEPAANILSVQHWKNSASFKSIKKKETQIKYYKRMNADADVLQLVELDSKPYGAAAEKIISEIFQLGPRTSTQNDGTFNGKKIEIKSARYWAGEDDCKWQHLEPGHDYEYVLFVIMDFHGFKVWGMKKSLVMGEMRTRKIVTYQGKQGWWTKMSAILPYLTPIRTREDLQSLVQ